MTADYKQLSLFPQETETEKKTVIPADKRLPIFLPLPIRHKSITHEPMLESIDIRRYLKEYSSIIENVSCGGESGPDARICDYGWVLNTHLQCVEYGVPFSYHQTGARLRKGDRVYDIMISCHL